MEQKFDKTKETGVESY